MLTDNLTAKASTEALLAGNLIANASTEALLIGDPGTLKQCSDSGAAYREGINRVIHLQDV